MAGSAAGSPAQSVGDAVSHLCRMGKAEAVAALEQQNVLPPRDFVVALWSTLPIEDAIEWSTFLLCGSTTPRAPVGECEQRRGVCGMVWKTGDTVYHCRTCGMDPSCAICLECFLNSNHEGHDYWMFSSGGGCCDCGDAEAWRPEGFCRNHCGVETSASDGEVLAGLAPFTLACTEGVLTGWAQLMLDRTRALAEQTRAVQWLTELAACSLTWRRLVGIALTAGGGGARSELREVSDEVVSAVARGAAAAAAQAPARPGDLERAPAPVAQPRGGAAARPHSQSLLAAFLRCEGTMVRGVREELHRLYFELMRDCPFKERLLCHIIEHYPSFVLQALGPQAAADSHGSLATDSTATTFGKFTVQFKGNMVSCMVERGLLPMLLETLLRVLSAAVEPPPARRSPALAPSGTYRLQLNGVEREARGAGGAAAADGLFGLESEDDEADWDWDAEEAAADGGGGGAPTRRFGTAGAAGEAERGEADLAAGQAEAAGAAQPAAADPAVPPWRQLTRGDEPLLPTGGAQPMDIEPFWQPRMLAPTDRPRGTAAAAGAERARGGRREGQRPAVVSARSKVVHSHLYAQLCYDIRYALNHGPIAASLVESDELLALLLRSISLVEGMHPMARATLAHVEHEDTAWGDAFSLATELEHLFPMVLAGVSAGLPAVPPGQRAHPTARARYGRLARGVCGALGGWLRGTGALSSCGDARIDWLLQRIRSDEGVRCAVSYHLPLHRLLAAVVSYGAVQLGLSAAELLPIEGGELGSAALGATGAPGGSAAPGSAAPGALPPVRLLLDRLTEQPLRLQLACAQTRAQLWVRNGYAALKQCALYRSALFADVCLAPDLSLLQLCAAQLGFAAFLRAALARWALPPMGGPGGAADGGAGSAFGRDLDGPVGEVLLEDLLATLTFVLRERTHSGDSAEQSAERTLVHRLASAGSATHSELVNAIPRRLVEMPSFDAILAKLAVHTPPRGLAQGTYSIRPSAWAAFDPLGYPFYSRTELHRALDRWQLTRQPGDESALPAAPEPPPLAPAFGALRTAARCGLLHALLLRALYTAYSGGGRESDGVAAVALRLLAECAFAEEAASEQRLAEAAEREQAEEGGTMWRMDVDEGAIPPPAASPARAPAAAAAAEGERSEQAREEAAHCRALSVELFGFELPSDTSLLVNVTALCPLSGAQPPPAAGQSEQALPHPQPQPPLAHMPWHMRTRRSSAAHSAGAEGAASAARLDFGPLQLPAPSLGGARAAAFDSLAAARTAAPTSPPLPPQQPQPQPQPAGGGAANGSRQGISLLGLLCAMASEERFAAHSAQLRDILLRLSRLDSGLRTAVSDGAPHVLGRQRGGALSDAGGPSAEPASISPVSPALGMSPARPGLQGSPGGGGAADTPSRAERKQRARERQAAILAQFASTQASFDSTAAAARAEPPTLQTTASGCACDHLDEYAAAGGGALGGGRPAAPSTPVRAGGAQQPGAKSARVGETGCADEGEADSLVCVLCHEEWRCTAAAAAMATGCEAELVGQLAYVQLAVTEQRQASDEGARHAIEAADEAVAGGARRAGGGEMAASVAAAAVAAAAAAAEREGGEHAESDLFVRLEDLTGPASDEVMAQVFAVMQAQHEADRQAGRLARARAPLAGAAAVAAGVATAAAAAAAAAEGVGAGEGGAEAAQSAQAPAAAPAACGWLSAGVSRLPALHVRFCGHAVHGRCLSRALVSLRPDSMSLDEDEFCCPLCKRVSNTLVPALPRAPLAAALRPADADDRPTTEPAAALPRTPPPMPPPRAFPPSLSPQASAAQQLAGGGAPAGGDEGGAHGQGGLRAWLHRQWGPAGGGGGGSRPPSARAPDTSGVRHLDTLVGTMRAVARQHEPLADAGAQHGAGGGVPGGAAVAGGGALGGAPLLLLAVGVTAAVMEAGSAAAADSPAGVRASEPQLRGLRALWSAALAMAEREGGEGSGGASQLATALRSALLLPSSPPSAAQPAAPAGPPLPLLLLEPICTSVCALALCRVPPPRAPASSAGRAAVAAVHGGGGGGGAAARAEALCSALRLLHGFAVAQALVCALVGGEEACAALEGSGLPWLAGWMGSCAPELHTLRLHAARAAGGEGGERGSAQGSAAYVSRSLLRHALAARRTGGGGGSSWVRALQRLTLRWLRCMHVLVRACMPAELPLLPAAAARLAAAADGAQGTNWAARPAAAGAEVGTEAGAGSGEERAGEYDTLCLELGLTPLQLLPAALAERWPLLAQWVRALAQSCGGAGAAPLALGLPAPPREQAPAAALSLGGAGVLRVCRWLGVAALVQPPFMSLPTHFGELYNRYVHFECSQCGTVPQQPAVCLLCAQLVCAGGQCCRKDGDDECHRHAARCGRGMCAFILLKASTTLLCVGRRHCFWGSLYLDSHGEEDRGLQRGRPLLLNQQRLHALHALYASLGVREYLSQNPVAFPHLLLLRARRPNQ